MGEMVCLGGGAYCTKYGLTDWYPDAEKEFRNLIESGDDFETEWCYARKELMSVKYIRKNGKFTIMADMWMDSLYDDGSPLIYDAMYDVCDMSALREKLVFDENDIDIEPIVDECYLRDIADTVSLVVDISCNSTFEEIKEAAVELSEELTKLIDEQYGFVKEIVKRYVVLYMEKE